MIPLLLSAGCTVMVNGKPRRIGGGGGDGAPAPVAAAPARAPQAAPATPAPPAAPAAPGRAPAARPPGQVIEVSDNLTSTPLVTQIGGVALDTTYSKVHGRGNSPDCGNDITAAPIASIVLKQPMAAMHLAVAGGSNDGFVLRSGDKLWFSCTHSIGQIPTVTSLREGWQPGRYDIYPISRYGKGARPNFSVEIFDPAKPAPWSERTRRVSLSGKLAKPMLVEVTTNPSRRILREAHAGYGCDKVALPDQPDLALVLERPIPGLIVRPLPSPHAVTMRSEVRDGKDARRGCRKYQRGVVPHEVTPSYESTAELHFGKDDEGTYGLSIGTADDKPATITLLIYDASTKLDQLAPFAYGGDTATLENRWLGYHYPQLDVRELTATKDHARAELTAQLFAAAPAHLRVYSKLDLDKDIASGTSPTFPKKNEPFLLLSARDGRAEVLAADGMRYHVKASHLVLQPDGPLAIPAAPRPLHKLDIGAALSLLPPSAKHLDTARARRLEAFQRCVSTVWAPYERQLPSITRPAGVDIVVYESARTKNIKAAGEAAIDATCGTDEQQERLTEMERVKMVAEIDKARAKRLAVAVAALK